MRLRSLQEARGIARHLVNFEIQPRPGAKAPERGDLQRVRNDQHRKRRALDLVDRKRNAIEGDRPFGSDES